MGFFPSIALAVLLIHAPPAVGEIGLVPALVPDQTTTRVVRLEPLTVPGFDAIVDDLQTLSSGERVFLIRGVGSLPVGLLIVVDPQGGRRLILTKGTVSRMRCAGDRIYTQERVTSMPEITPQMHFVKRPTAGDAPPDDGIRYFHLIRRYDPAGSTSKTLVVAERGSVFEFFPGPDCLHLFDVSRAGIHISTLSLSSNSKETTTVTLADTGQRVSTGGLGPFRFLLRNGWAYYRAALTDKTTPRGDAASTAPFVLANAVCRANLATGERQTIVEGRYVFSYCLTEKPESLVYLAPIDDGDRRYLGCELGVVPLDPPAPAATYRLEAVQSRLWYDEAAKTVVLEATHFLAERDPDKDHLLLWREEAPRMRDLYRVVIED